MAAPQTLFDYPVIETTTPLPSTGEISFGDIQQLWHTIPTYQEPIRFEAARPFINFVEVEVKVTVPEAMASELVQLTQTIFATQTIAEAEVGTSNGLTKARFLLPPYLGDDTQRNLVSQLMALREPAGEAFELSVNMMPLESDFNLDTILEPDMPKANWLTEGF